MKSSSLIALPKVPTPVHVQPATTSVADPPRHWPQLTAGHLKDFAIAWGIATILVRTLPFNWAIRRVEKRKKQNLQKSRAFNAQQVWELTTLHLALYPAFGSENEIDSMHSSLTLIEFLARYTIYPAWVFAVKVPQMTELNWLQYESTVLTAPLEQVTQFTPTVVI